MSQVKMTDAEGYTIPIIVFSGVAITATSIWLGVTNSKLHKIYKSAEYKKSADAQRQRSKDFNETKFRKEYLALNNQSSLPVQQILSATVLSFILSAVVVALYQSSGQK